MEKEFEIELTTHHSMCKCCNRNPAIRSEYLNGITFIMDSELCDKCHADPDWKSRTPTWISTFLAKFGIYTRRQRERFIAEL